MTLLVTGAGGFVGLNILEAALSAGQTVCALSDRPLFAPALKAFQNLPGTLDVVTADVRNQKALTDAFARHDVAQVIHAAAITLGPASTLAPAETVIDVNVVGTQNVMDAARAAGVSRFIYPSSVAVYGLAPFRAPVTEETPPEPAGLYGFTKLACERLVMAAQRKHGLDVAIGRIVAVFGPWEHDTGVRETLSAPFQLAGRALDGLPAGMPEGGARDWTSSRDVARALLTLATASDLPRTVYNISASEIWHPRLLADALSERTGQPIDTALKGGTSDIAFNDNVDAVRNPVSGTALRDDFGFSFMPAREAVADYADWVLKSGRAALGAPAAG
ncbi:NAD(P)-dependent oxidoreductase [Acuticoccus sp. MNP-M23]|uniref:NAD-dependent epimerase/dehydratase family protein n=1 Tax=Acuticoccus sp. MNP-M23 TaxID=3072793 RepID=UPI0028161A23|nr:NAD(P)-dependent oxidoreductase [Acuticoccus sp. MNP-M23]WMS42586.1 NAD(P)-dependent oxidoreductase [Acuticoccus sp. MNP-M23]